MKLTVDAKGVFIISATPFTDAGAIDFDSADRLVEFYLDKGVTGMTILGMMGEAPKLSGEESTAFLSHMLERVAGRVPVIVGVSSPGIDNLAQLSHAAMDNGAAGVMVAPMRGLATEEKLYGYFAQVFEALGPDVPVCYQDFPLSTGVSISATLFNRLVQGLRTARHAQARRLARPEQADGRAVRCVRHRGPPGVDPVRKRRTVSSRRNDP